MATTAKTKKDVDEMTNTDSLWDSLQHSYGKKAEDISKNYDKAIAQQDNAMLARGMQRSSYGAQTRANMLGEKNKAISANWDDMIADYENRRMQEADKEWERAFQEKQLAQNQSQFETNLAFQKEENALGRAFTTSEREATQAYGTGEREAQQAYQSSENALNRAQSQAQFEANLAEQKTQNAWNRAFQESEAAREQTNTEWTQAFQKEQFAAQQDQWKQEFNYQQKSDDQKIAASYAMQIIQQGGNPSDDLLARAGLSRNDANSMKAQVAAGGGGSYRPKTTPDEEPKTTTSDFLNNLYGSGISLPAAAAVVSGSATAESKYNDRMAKKGDRVR